MQSCRAAYAATRVSLTRAMCSVVASPTGLASSRFRCGGEGADEVRVVSKSWRIFVKRLIIALVLGLVVFASVYAFAATLNVNTKSLGAGGNAVASCNASANVTYNA